MYTVLEKGGVCSPKGFTASGICAGIKASGNADMALLKSEKAARCFAVFTTNKVKAAPVLYEAHAEERACLQHGRDWPLDADGQDRSRYPEARGKAP